MTKWWVEELLLKKTAAIIKTKNEGLRIKD